MFKTNPLFIILLNTWIMLGAAAPTDDAQQTYPSIVPGPGMPTPESLNLTTADLFNTSTIETHTHRFPALHTLNVGTLCQGTTLANNNDVVACFNYLYALGPIFCGGNGNTGSISNFVRAGSALVVGTNFGAGGVWGSYCTDVAYSVADIYVSCRGARSQTALAGDSFAYGNGNLHVTVDSGNID